MSSSSDAQQAALVSWPGLGTSVVWRGLAGCGFVHIGAWARRPRS